MALRVPPDVAASPVRPRECMLDCNQDQKHLSKPQKRRKRAQDLAAAKALQARRLCTVVAQCDQVRLDNMESMICEIHGFIKSLYDTQRFNQHLACSYYYDGWCASDYCGEERTVHGCQQQQLQWNAEQRSLNPTAPAFDPAAVAHCSLSSAGDFRSTSSPGHESQRSSNVAAEDRVPEDRSACPTCKLPDSECECQMILCNACFRTADDCDCDEPQLRTTICSACQAEQQRSSLHTDSFIQRPTHSTRTCFECNNGFFVPGGWNYISASEHRCQRCARRDAQRLIQECDGLCGGLFHTDCMVKIDEKFVCLQCQANGTVIGDSPDTDSTSHPSCGEGDSEDKSASIHIWDATEAMQWYKMTSRMLQEQFTLQDCFSLLDDRWAEAWPHLDDTLRGVMQEGLEGLRASIIDGFAKGESKSASSASSKP